MPAANGFFCRIPRRVLLLACALSCAAALLWPRQAEADPPPEEAKPWRVLFIGNSFTFFNELPEVLESLVKASGEKRGIEVGARTLPGAKLKDHWDRDSAKAIRDARWDFVVLQEQSVTPLASVGRDDLFYPYARKFDEVIRTEGGVPLFYMTWKRPGAKEEQAEWTESYLGIARELKARVCPAGMAVETVLKKKPKFGFHADPIGHPTPAGTYLVACTFFATIYDRSPEGLPASVKTRSGLEVGVKSEDLELVHASAWEAVQAVKERLQEEK